MDASLEQRQKRDDITRCIIAWVRAKVEPFPCEIAIQRSSRQYKRKLKRYFKVQVTYTPGLPQAEWEEKEHLVLSQYNLATATVTLTPIQFTIQGDPCIKFQARIRDYGRLCSQIADVSNIHCDPQHLQANDQQSK